MAMITYINYSSYNWKKCSFFVSHGQFVQLFIFILAKFFKVACGKTYCIKNFSHQKNLCLSGDTLKMELHFAQLCFKDWDLPSRIPRSFILLTIFKMQKE